MTLTLLAALIVEDPLLAMTMGKKACAGFFWEKFKSFGAEVKRDHWEGEVGGDYKRRF